MYGGVVYAYCRCLMCDQPFLLSLRVVMHCSVLHCCIGWGGVGWGGEGGGTCVYGVGVGCMVG